MAGGRIQRELALLLTGKDVSWSKTTKGAEKSMKRLHDAGAKAGTNMARNLERGVVIASAAAVGAGAFAVDQAMQFESSSASVRKTVEGNVDAILAASRELAKTTGLEVNALNEISATAGALGIAKDDIDDFTKTVSMLGQTTDDVTTDVGATSLGHLKTTLNLAGTDFEHLGNTLVSLGNDGASTEGQILSMTENIAGAANTMDASTQQVLGWAAALANTGEEAEAGGSSIQRFWLESFKSVNKGGKELKLMAKISGQTADQFAKDFGQDATGTLAKFIVSLGKVSKAEQLATLEALGFTDIRITRALLKLLGNTDNLIDSLALSEKGWLENSAGTEEWAKRLDTTASKLAVLKANVNDAAITIGTELLPVLAELSTDAVKWISEHQGDIRQFSQDLASGVREAVTWARSLDWDAIGSGLKIAAGAAGAIVQAFASAPPWVQAFLVGGFAANKFTGGAVGDVIKIAFDQFAGRGTSPANPVWVQSAGGALGGAGATGGKFGGVGGALTKVFIAGAAVGVFAELKGILDEQSAANREQGANLDTQLGDFLKVATQPELERALAGLEAESARLNRDFSAEGLAFQLNIDGARDAMDRQIAGLKSEIERLEKGGARQGGARQGPPGMGGTAPDDPRRTGRAFGGISPGERDERLAGIMARAAKAGRAPRDPLAAAQATLTRNIARDQAAARAAIERTNAKLEAARASASASSLAEQRAGERQAGLIVAAIKGLSIPAPTVIVENSARSVDQVRTRYFRVNNRPPGTGPTID
jgi:TP901 family phage tail tape measure protein